MSRSQSGFAVFLVAVTMVGLERPCAGGESVAPLGDDFQVNSYTTGSQGAASISAAPDGRFVVVWGGPEIRGRRFAADGTPAGGELQINTVTEDLQTSWDVAMAPDGSFMVVFNHRPSSSAPDSIQARIFDADGHASGPEFQVATSTLFSPFGQFVRQPSVAVDSSGEFVVAWADEEVQCALGYCGIDANGMARRFSSQGASVGEPFQVAENIPYLARRPNGEFLVVWHGIVGLRGQQFDAGANPVGGQFGSSMVGPVTSDFSLAMNDTGEFVVAWSRGYVEYVPNPPFMPLDVRARRFTAAGEELGAELVVADSAYGYGPPYPHSPVVGVDAGGGFVIVWSDNGEIGGRDFASSGSGGSEFAVNSYTTGSRGGGDIAFSSSGEFIVVWSSSWSSGSDDDGSSIQARRFVRPELFGDGFESGDTRRWSAPY